MSCDHEADCEWRKDREIDQCKNKDIYCAMREALNILAHMRPWYEKRVKHHDAITPGESV